MYNIKSTTNLQVQTKIASSSTRKICLKLSRLAAEEARTSLRNGNGSF